MAVSVVSLALLLSLIAASPVAPADGAAFAAAVAGRDIEITLVGGRIVAGTLLSRAASGYLVRTERGDVVTVVDDEIDKLRVELPGERYNETLVAMEKRVAALEAGPAGPPPKAKQDKAWTLPAGDSAFYGPKNAPIVITMFGNLQCPFTARTMPVIKAVVDDPRFKGRVKLVFKHFPLSFHTAARPAAQAAIAARRLGGDPAFFAMLDKALAAQKALTRNNFTAWAVELGLNATAFKKLLKTNVQQAEGIIDADLQLGQEVGVRGSPSLFVNGWVLDKRSADGVDALITEQNLPR